MTAQHPAAPETETDANGLLSLRRFAEAQAITAKARGREDRDWLDALILIERAEADLDAARERVRVVEGERDAARARVEEVVQLNTEKARHQRELMARLAEVAEVAEERGNEVQAQKDRAESAEAAHEAEKAAHERLRAGVEALADEYETAARAAVKGGTNLADRELRFALNVIDDLRSLLGGGGER